MLCALFGTLSPAAFGALAGFPEPLVHDEYSYLLGADTFARGRLTNPAPPLPEFFEAPHVLVTPTYQSKYPPGQAFVLALGQVIFGHPIWGIWLSCGFFSASLCWMLQAWASRHWALTITLVTVATLGTSTYWAQSYWGGMVAASGAAILFGGLRRTLRALSVVTSALIGLGAIILANSRPYEGFLASLPAATLLCRWILSDRSHTPVRKLWIFVLPLFTVLTIGCAGMGLYNRAVTGKWRQLPYSLHTSQYFHQGIFLFSPLQAPQRTPVLRLASFYQSVTSPPLQGVELIAAVARNAALRLPLSLGVPFGFVLAPRQGRVAFCGVLIWATLLVPFLTPTSKQFFLPAVSAGLMVEWLAWQYLPLYPWPLLPLVLAAWLLAFDRFSLRSYPWASFIGMTIFVVLVGHAFVTWWSAHYLAPVVPLVLAVAATSLQRVARKGRVPAARRLRFYTMVLLLSHFLAVSAAQRFQMPRGSDASDKFQTQKDVKDYLRRKSGTHLVFVNYHSAYSVHREWVYNGADLSSSAIVFAHDLGDLRNPELMAAYPTRTAWTLTVGPEQAHISTYNAGVSPTMRGRR